MVWFWSESNPLLGIIDAVVLFGLALYGVYEICLVLKRL